MRRAWYLSAVLIVESWSKGTTGGAGVGHDCLPIKDSNKKRFSLTRGSLDNMHRTTDCLLMKRGTYSIDFLRMLLYLDRNQARGWAA